MPSAAGTGESGDWRLDEVLGEDFSAVVTRMSDWTFT